MWLSEGQEIAVDPAMRCGHPRGGRAGPAVLGGVRVGGLGVDHELAVADWGVNHDDVLEVEQVGVLRGGYHRSGRVDQFARGPVTVGEHGEDAAGA
jgi:hypothetical protein